MIKKVALAAFFFRVLQVPRLLRFFQNSIPMKKLISFVFTLFLGVNFHAQIKFETFPSYEAALKKSVQTKKPMFVDTYADWCGWCKYMDKNIFSDPDVGNYFNQHFLCFKLDTEVEKNEYFSAKYEISGLPCLLLLDEKGEILYRNDGAFTDKDEFIEFGKMAYYKLNPETSPWKQNEVKFNNGERSPEFLKDYAESMVKGDYPMDEVMKIVQLYWQQTTEKSLTNEMNFEVFYDYHNEFTDPLYKEFIDDKTKLIDAFGEKVYYGKCVEILKENLQKAIDKNDQSQYDKVMGFVEVQFKDQKVYEYQDVVDFVKGNWEDREKE